MTDQEFRKSINETEPFMFGLYRQYNGDKFPHKHHATHEHVSKLCEW